MTDDPADAGDPAAIERTRRRQREADKEAAKFWRGVLADPVGRREVWTLLQLAHVFETRFACGPTGFPQPEATWFHAGEQDFGLRLYRSLLRMDMEGVRIMHHEFDPDFTGARG